jgi:cyanophycin synthetase
MSGMAGIPVGYGKTVSRDRPGVYDVYVRFKNESGMRELLRIAVDLADALLAGRAFPLDERLDKVRALVAETTLGASTAALVEAAQRRGIPLRRLNDESLVQLGYGCKLRRIEAAVSSNTSHLSVEIAADKHLTRKLLQESALPVPDGEVVSEVASAIAAAHRFGFPVVLKPLDGNHGRGVTVGVAHLSRLAKGMFCCWGIASPPLRAARRQISGQETCRSCTLQGKD